LAGGVSETFEDGGPLRAVPVIGRVAATVIFTLPDGVALSGGATPR
jgi:hypothetical protein